MARALALVTATALATLGLASLTSASPASARCKPTLSDGAGPFQQGGVTVPRRAKIGKGHVLLGRVLRTDCKPVPRATVILWQAGPQGYGPRGRGRVVTDRRGNFRFQGPVPSSYGREPHIHIVVFHPAYEEVSTRYVVRRGSKSGRITIVLTPLL